MSETPPHANEESSASPQLEYSPPQSASPTAVIWCRILALWLLAFGLYSASDEVRTISIYLFEGGNSFRQIRGARLWLILELIPSVVWFVMAWYCWAKAPRIAARMLNDLDHGPGTPQAMSSDDLLRILLIAIGAYMLAEGMPPVLRAIYESIHNGLAPLSQILENNSNAATGLIRCALGLWLILDPRRIAMIINRPRREMDEAPPRAAVPPPPPPYFRPDSGLRATPRSRDTNDPTPRS